MITSLIIDWTGGMDSNRPISSAPRHDAARVFDLAADDYDDGIGLFASFGRRLVETVLLQPGERVLDVACGAGASLLPAAAAVGPGGYVHGIDVAPGMVGRCRAALADGGHTQGDVSVMPAEGLPFPDGSFDVVCCGFGMFFFSDPVATVGHFRRVLAPGGRLGFSLFDGPVLWEWLLPTLLEQTPQPHPEPHAMWAAEGAATVLAAAGFDEIETTEVREIVAVPDVDALWRWLWAGGARMMLETMSEETQERLYADIADRLEGQRGGDGFESIQRAVIMLARSGP